MGFFSKVRRRIKKLIPKEIRPFVPYIAAAIPGAGLGLGALGGTGAMGSFLRAGAYKGLTDDEADIKDILRTGAIAAAPQMIDAGLGKLDTGKGLGKFLNQPGKDGAPSFLSKAKNLSSTDGSRGFMDTAKVVGTQGSIDYGLKAAELNEDALADYNRMLAEQGIADKAGRRAAIRAIYSNTGTWDMDEVDSMLDTYGYRTGGRVGYAEGGMSDIEKKIQIMREAGMTEKQIVEYLQGGMGDISQEAMMFEDAYSPITNMEEGMPKELAIMQLEEALSTPGMENVGIRSVIDIVDKAADKQQLDNSLRKLERDVIDYDAPPSDYELRVKRLGLGDGGETEEERRRRKRREKFTEGFEYAQEGLESLEDLEDKYKPLPIRELRLADGGSTSDTPLMDRVKELQDEGLDFSSAMAQAIEELQARDKKARGGITDINMEEQIDTPSGDMMMDENVEVASNPEVMDSLNELSLMLFRRPLSDLSDDEYEELKDFAGQTSLKPGLIDEYRNYKYNAEEQGQTPMSPRDYFQMEFGAARMGVAKGGLMNLGGREMDLRGGGFVPMGAKERADDVPARLSKNEFVMTADAVRAAGGGSVQKGADLMYDQMKQLEGQA